VSAIEYVSHLDIISPRYVTCADISPLVIGTWGGVETNICRLHRFWHCQIPNKEMKIK